MSVPDDPAIQHATYDSIMSAIEAHKRDSNDRFERGNERFASMSADIAVIKEAVMLIPKIQTDLAETTGEVKATREIVEAWSAVKTMGKFVKWVAPLLAAGAVAWATIKGLFLSDLKH